MDYTYNKHIKSDPTLHPVLMSEAAVSQVKANTDIENYHEFYFPFVKSRLNWILDQGPNLGSAGISGSRGPENGVARWQ